MARMVYTAVLSALVVTLVAAQSGSFCEMNHQELQKVVLECVVQKPSLFFDVTKHMGNPKSMATVEFICQNSNDMVGIVLCMEDKLASCYPLVKDTIKQYLPNQERLSKAMGFLCKHKKDFVENSCMDQGQAQEFMQCYMGQMASTLTKLRSDHDIQTAMCSVIHSEEQCIKSYHGSCSAGYVDLVIQLLDILVPYCPKLVLDLKNQATNNALGSILAHGQPLQFQPQGEVKYNIVNG